MADNFKLSEPTIGTAFKSKNIGGFQFPGKILYGENGFPISYYASPNSKNVLVSTSREVLFSDDFGGAAVDTAKWDVIDGGLAAIVSGNAVAQLGDNPTPGFSQGAIGTGTVGITDSVAASALSVVMGLTNNAERWYLSRQTFSGGAKAIHVLINKSQANVNNSIMIGFVEVDPTTGIPLLNANLALDFTNRGGAEYGKSATTTAYHAEAVADSSPAVASGATGVATAFTTTQECIIEVDGRDVTTQTQLIDSVAARVSGGSRVSTQVPNAAKLYKLVMRFKNVGVPTATTVLIPRIAVFDNHENRVQVTGGEGDVIGSKAMPVLLAGAIGATTSMGAVGLTPSASLGAATYAKLIAANSTNSTLVKSTAGTITGGRITNTSAARKWVKFYNKATAPTVGTDVPIYTISLAAGESVNLGEVAGAFGNRFSTGIGYGITGAAADNDTTSVAAGDVEVNITYT